jgi:peroxiredoxin Q/BCP
MVLKIGDMAPDFELPSQDGAMVSLSSFRGKKGIVLYFYPKDFTPGCTKQACVFRDMYSEFQKAGAEVVGVSSDSMENHLAFSRKYSLPFQLLSDTAKTVRRLYGVKDTLGILQGRVTFIIDRSGVIRGIYSSQIMLSKHGKVALEILRNPS